MGLLDRIANQLIGPEPPEPTPQHRPLTASGARVNLRSPSLVHTKHPEWQTAAWNYRDSVDELRYAATFVASSLGRLRVFAAQNRPRGEDPSPLDPTGTIPQQVAAADGIDDTTRAAAIALVERLNINAHGNTLLGRMAENLEVAGECYLLGELDDEGQEQWSIRSVRELIITQGGARLVDPAGGMVTRELDPEAVDVLRLWTPHPAYAEWPDAPTATLLGTLEGMVLLARRGRAHDRSRISSGKALFLPDELSLTRPGAAPVDPQDQGVFDDDADDPFMAALVEAMVTPIQNEDDPSAVVPLLIRGPSMAGDKPMKDVIGVINLHGEDPTDLDDRYEALVQRLARGLDLAPERVKGLGNTNHWSANTIASDEVKVHIEPRAERMCDALTAAYLRPALKAMGIPAEQRNKVCLWYDPAELVQNPNPEERAAKAHDAGVISDEAYRRELGYDEKDKPDEVERLLRTLTQGRAYEASIPWVIAMSGLNLQDREIRDAVQLVNQIKSSASGAAGPRQIVDATPTAGRPAGAPPPAGDRQAPPTPPAGVTAAAKGKGPRDDPSGPSVAGLALMAADTGRVLMIQRAADDPDDPAAGTWEFPGGHIEDGDDTSLHGAMREWSEEVGHPVPDGGDVLHTWTAPNGIYQGHVVVIDTEDQLDLGAKRTVKNPDDDAEQVAWWDPDHAAKNPALRRECKKTPWSALKRAVKTRRSPVVAAAATADWRVERRAGRQLARIDRDLTTALHAHLDGALDRAVEKAANRVRGQHARKSSPLVASFPQGADPRPIIAEAGRVMAGPLTDHDLFDDAFGLLERAWLRDADTAADQVAAVLDATLPADARPVAASARTDRVRDELRANARKAAGWMIGWAKRRAAQLLYGETGDQQPVPASVPRRVVTETGGLPDQHPGFDDETGQLALDAAGRRPPATGPGTGEVALAELRVAGGVVMGWEWEYGVVPRDSFEPHQRLDELVFEDWSAPELKVQQDDAWLGVAHYSPGDHRGCRCTAAPIAVIPMTAVAAAADPPGALLAGVWNEALHPRGQRGRWTFSSRNADLPRGGGDRPRPTMSTAERRAELYRRLDQLPPARNAREAMQQVGDTLDAVEDEHSGVKANPNPGLAWDGRMYPPRDDYITENPDGSLTAKTKGNVIDTTAGGGIRITKRPSGDIVYSKKGAGDA